MNFKTTIKYQEGFLPTPRCRKSRYKTVEESISTEIEEISKELAPVAFTCDGNEYRLYNEQLYVRANSVLCCDTSNKHLKDDIIGQLKYVFEMCSSFYGFEESDSKEKMVKKAENYAGRFLIIDGSVWEKSGEPRYVVMVFGLGRNHASTALMISTGYNSNISNSAYFNAFERDKALEEALSTATKRGDTNSIERIKDSTEIKVLIPSAVKCNPKLDHCE